jgi:hypothetical protein
VRDKTAQGSAPGFRIPPLQGIAVRSTIVTHAQNGRPAPKVRDKTAQGFVLGFHIPPLQGIAVHWTIFLIPAKWSPGTEGAR